MPPDAWSRDSMKCDTMKFATDNAQAGRVRRSGCGASTVPRQASGIGVWKRIARQVEILVLCAAVLSGCELFSTRDPEPPSSGSSTYTPPTSPDLVLTNLRNAVLEKNTENYLRCLVDTLNSSRAFAFFPASAAAARYPSAFQSWSLQSEKSYFSALVAITPKNAASVLILTGGFTMVASDSALYACDYQATFLHGIAGVPETVRGNLQLVLAPDRNSFWSIVRWTDIALAAEPSWSEWKGRFSN